MRSCTTIEYVAGLCLRYSGAERRQCPQDGFYTCGQADAGHTERFGSIRAVPAPSWCSHCVQVARGRHIFTNITDNADDGSGREAR